MVVVVVVLGLLAGWAVWCRSRVGLVMIISKGWRLPAGSEAMCVWMGFEELTME
jgi:hypothetical protein